MASGLRDEEAALVKLALGRSINLSFESGVFTPIKLWPLRLFSMQIALALITQPSMVWALATPDSIINADMKIIKASREELVTLPNKDLIGEEVLERLFGEGLYFMI